MVSLTKDIVKNKIKQFYRVVCYDFETIQDYSIQEFSKADFNKKTKLAEEKTKLFSFSFSVIDYETKSSITRDLFFKLDDWADYTDLEQNTLRFHKITNQEDIDKHNEKHKDKMVDTSLAFLKFKNCLIGKFKDKSYNLLGYNNNKFDNFFLNYYLTKYFGEDFAEEVIDNSFDLYGWLFEIKTNGAFNSIEKTRYHLDLPSYKLSNLYKSIFGVDFDAHISVNDVKATFQIYRHYLTLEKDLSKSKLLESMVRYKNEFVNLHNRSLTLEDIEKPKLDLKQMEKSDFKNYLKDFLKKEKDQNNMIEKHRLLPLTQNPFFDLVLQELSWEGLISEPRKNLLEVFI